MLKLKAEAAKIFEVLSLTWAPIAGKFSDDAEKEGSLTRKLSVCEALNMARRENVVIILSKENCTCPGGRYFTGLDIVPVESFVPTLATKRHRVYDSAETALSSVRKQPRPRERGSFFTLGPLEKLRTNPDLVFLFATPAQADRMLGLVSYEGSEPFMYYPASSICSTITNVLAKNRPEINLISTFERKAGKWSPNELILAMPYKDFETAVKNISKSGYGPSGNTPTKTLQKKKPSSPPLPSSKMQPKNKL
jgi:uncharacterized protein (DUF169 family)